MARSGLVLGVVGLVLSVAGIAVARSMDVMRAGVTELLYILIPLVVGAVLDGLGIYRSIRALVKHDGSSAAAAIGIVLGAVGLLVVVALVPTLGALLGYNG
jgi:uncharacterized membrane protein